MRLFSVRAVVTILAIFGAVPTARAGVWQQSEGTFLALTRRGGIASALAHNHVIAIREPQIEVGDVAGKSLAGDVPFPESVKLSFPVAALEVDDPTLAAQVYPRLKEVGLYASPFSELSESDRKTIRENMLADDQLWERKYPSIEMEASSFRIRSKTGAETALAFLKDLAFKPTHEAEVFISIRGKTVRKTFPLIVSVEIDSAEGTGTVSPTYNMTLEGLTPARFDDFGFDAYSALLGAIKNQDVFFFYFKVAGSWKP